MPATASLVTAVLLPSRHAICAAAASSARGGVGSCLRRPSSARRAGVRCNSAAPTPPGFPGQTPPEMPATNRPPAELPSVDTPPEVPATSRPPEEMPSVDTPPEFEAPPGVDVPVPGAPTPPGPELPGPSIPSPSTPEVPAVPPNPDVPPPKPPEVDPPGAPPEVVPPEPPGAALWM